MSLVDKRRSLLKTGTNIRVLWKEFAWVAEQLLAFETLWQWYINIIIVFMDIIHRPVFV
jgi:hypothetical protein